MLFFPSDRKVTNQNLVWKSMKRPSTALRFLTAKKLKYAILFNEIWERDILLHFWRLKCYCPIIKIKIIIKLRKYCQNGTQNGVEGIKVLDDNITYLVSYRRSIKIWRVCKIYGRRGGAEPSIYFTNPTYFYRPSWTDQISVLFRRGPWIVYTVTKMGKKSTQASYIYSRVLRAKMWRYDLRGRRHRRRY